MSFNFQSKLYSLAIEQVDMSNCALLVSFNRTDKCCCKYCYAWMSLGNVGQVLISAFFKFSALEYFTHFITSNFIDFINAM